MKRKGNSEVGFDGLANFSGPGGPESAALKPRVQMLSGYPRQGPFAWGGLPKGGLPDPGVVASDHLKDQGVPIIIDGVEALSLASGCPCVTTSRPAGTVTEISAVANAGGIGSRG